MHPLLGKISLIRRLFTCNMVFEYKAKSAAEISQWQ